MCNISKMKAEKSHFHASLDLQSLTLCSQWLGVKLLSLTGVTQFSEAVSLQTLTKTNHFLILECQSKWAKDCFRKLPQFLKKMNRRITWRLFLKTRRSSKNTNQTKESWHQLKRDSPLSLLQISGKSRHRSIKMASMNSRFLINRAWDLILWPMKLWGSSTQSKLMFLHWNPRESKCKLLGS